MSSMKQIDERDVMIARGSYTEGTFRYNDYYSKNPDKKATDDRLRSLPEMFCPGGEEYDLINSPIAEANFEFLADISRFCEGKVNPNRVSVNTEEITHKLKQLAFHYGAKLVGTVSMQDYHYYSHRGRQEDSYGQKVEPTHKFGIAFAVEMDRVMINNAPKVAEVIETSYGYVKAAIIGMQISYYIRSLGYDARNHMDGNYLVVCPLVAWDAGIGEIGRMGLLVTKEYGPRVRLGVVTTELPLIADGRADFGVQEFCRICNKCSKVCSGEAIPSGDKELIDGVSRWQIVQEKCYEQWRVKGTDCGECLKVCPFSQGLDLRQVEKLQENPGNMISLLKEYNKLEKQGINEADIPDWLKRR